jgi:Protein of unknown function (DUF1640)
MQSMIALTFDTLKFTRKLESAGLPREQAIGIAEAVADVQRESVGELATKADVDKLRVELKNEIDRLRTDMENRFEKIEMSMMIKFGFMQAGVLGIIALMIRYLTPH